MPVDRPAEAAAELAPVFALLAGTEAEVARLAADALARAAHLRAAAARAAAGLESDALTRAPRERATADRDAAPADGDPDPDDDPLPARRARTAEQLPLLTGRAVDDVRCLLDPSRPRVRP